MDAYGYLQIKGRVKDLIIRGGENIYPAEIEKTLHTHPKVQEAQVSSGYTSRPLLVELKVLFSFCVSGGRSGGPPHG